MSEKKSPYQVEVDEDGCPQCSAGRSWTVVGPDGFAASTSWEDREEAEKLAERLNEAWADGYKVGVSDGGERER